MLKGKHQPNHLLPSAKNSGSTATDANISLPMEHLQSVQDASYQDTEVSGNYREDNFIGRQQSGIFQGHRKFNLAATMKLRTMHLLIRQQQKLKTTTGAT